MFFFNSSSKKKNSANIAKERLQIIIAHRRNELNNSADKSAFISKIQEEILMVLKKYVHIDQKDIKIELDNQNDYSVLELNVTIPEDNTRIAR